MIDTHSHIYDDAFAEDFGDVVQRAKDNGVEKMIMPAIDSTYHDKMMRCAEQLKDYAMPCIGLHPTSVGEGWEKELEFVHDKAETGHYYAIGEIGLDEYWSKERLEEQKMVFLDQLNLSCKLRMPVIIHSREATEDIFEILEKANKPLTGVFHAYSGSYETYLIMKKYGDFKVGIGGVVTYKNSGVAKILEEIPISDIILETDAPWLTPVPFRGKRNESSYIRFTASKVADIMHLPLEYIDRITTENAKQLFKLQ